MRFDFDGKIEKEVLENYLSRCATAAGLYQSETLSDDLRVIKKLGIKFLGRASGIWYMTETMRNILNVPESWRNGCMSSTRRSFCRRACLR